MTPPFAPADWRAVTPVSPPQADYDSTKVRVVTLVVPLYKALVEKEAVGKEAWAKPDPSVQCPSPPATPDLATCTVSLGLVAVPGRKGCVAARNGTRHHELRP